MSQRLIEVPNCATVYLLITQCRMITLKRHDKLITADESEERLQVLSLKPFLVHENTEIYDGGLMRSSEMSS